MSFEANWTGTLTAIGELKQGVSQRGNAWKRQVFVISDLDSRMQDHIHITAMNDLCDIFDTLHNGDKIAVRANIYDRNYQGKDYTSIDALNIVKLEEAKQPEQAAPASAAKDDDLPF